MIELDEVDLAKDLSRLSRQLARASADIVTELDSPERTYELVEQLQVAARKLRTRARAALPNVIEPHHGQETTVTEHEHSTADEDLAATLTELLQRLSLVAPMLADQLADTLTQMARQVDPTDITARLQSLAITLQTGTGPVSGPYRDDARGVQPPVQPIVTGEHAGRHRLRESASGPGWPEWG